MSRVIAGVSRDYKPCVPLRVSVKVDAAKQADQCLQLKKAPLLAKATLRNASNRGFYVGASCRFPVLSPSLCSYEGSFRDDRRHGHGELILAGGGRCVPNMLVARAQCEHEMRLSVCYVDHASNSDEIC